MATGLTSQVQARALGGAPGMAPLGKVWCWLLKHSR